LKTKELIRRLNQLDPSGEIEVVVDSADIYFLSKEPMYYDGRPIRLLRDPDLEGKAYSITGFEIMETGEKIRIRIMGAADVIADFAENHRECKIIATAEARYRYHIDDMITDTEAMQQDVERWRNEEIVKDVIKK
jgi:hypothetical protein